MSESTTERREGLLARLASILLLQVERIKGAVFKRGLPRRMVLVEALELGNRRQLFLVACDDQRFLVGAGRDRIGTLVAFPESSPKSASDAASGDMGVQPVIAARGSVRGRQPAWMARSGFERDSGRGLELVRRDHLVCAPSGGREFEVGKTQ